MLMLNKQERQVIKFELDKEQKVLDDLERQYKKALKDIDEKIKMLQSDELTKSRIYQIQYQQALRGQVAGILDKLQGDEFATIQQYLHESYQDGFIGTMYSIHGQGIPLIVPLDQDAAVKAIITDSKISEGLYKHLGVNVKQLKQAIRSEITRGIASNMPFADIARNISNRSKASLGRAKTIVRTEAHRIQQAAASDARDAAKERGCDVVKQWDSTLDSGTRPTHKRLDGQIRETDKPFEIDKKKKAMYPGDFGYAEEDCNCRCVALTRAKWALDEEELEILKKRAKEFGLKEEDKKAFGRAKAKDFAEFRKKYLKASERVSQNMVRASKIEANGLFVNRTEKLHRYAQNIPPLEGYEDFTCHADADSFYIDLGGTGNAEDFFQLTPEEYADRIRASTTYKGGNIRIISCQAGAKDNGAAQRLADALGVDVYAPTETVHVTENGEIFVTDNDILAELWYNEDDRSVYKETGTWRLFKPRKG